MEEENIIPDWEEIILPEVTYSAVFDPDTGMIQKVGPSFAFDNEKYKVALDKNLALDIIDSKILITNCFVDLHSGKVEITEVKTLQKIDDVLHRIPLKKHSKIKDADIFITTYEKTNKIKFELNTLLGGTKKVNSNEDNFRKIFWQGDTELKFLITEYNDPHVVFDTVTFTINDLIKKPLTFKTSIPKTFSVFTRRILKNYILEEK